jgi:hypothetical protein
LERSLKASGKTDPTRAAAFVALALLLASEASAEAAPDGTQFCSLRAAPLEATRRVTHGVSLSIFPDAQAITTEFSGCQNVWLSDGLLLAQAQYKNGEVVKYVGSHPDGRSVSCLYESRRLTAAAGDCPAFEDFPLGKSGKAR